MQCESAMKVLNLNMEIGVGKRCEMLASPPRRHATGDDR